MARELYADDEQKKKIIDLIEENRDFWQANLSIIVYCLNLGLPYPQATVAPVIDKEVFKKIFSSFDTSEMEGKLFLLIESALYNLTRLRNC